MRRIYTERQNWRFYWEREIVWLGQKSGNNCGVKTSVTVRPVQGINIKLNILFATTVAEVLASSEIFLSARTVEECDVVLEISTLPQEDNNESELVK